MITAIRTAGIAVAVVLFLCITVRGRTLFSHIYSVLSPVTTAVQGVTEDMAGKAFDATNAYTKKLFDNSVPKFKDSVKSRASAIKKGEPQDDIPIEDKQELNQLIKTH